MVTLDSGCNGTASVCLPNSAYKPFSCGGNYPSEISWKWIISENITYDGHAGVVCSPKASGNIAYTVETLFPSLGAVGGGGKPKQSAPTFSPTQAPSLSAAPTHAPTVDQSWNFGLGEYVL